MFGELKIFKMASKLTRTKTLGLYPIQTKWWSKFCMVSLQKKWYRTNRKSSKEGYQTCRLIT